MKVFDLFFVDFYEINTILKKLQFSKFRFTICDLEIVKKERKFLIFLCVLFLTIHQLYRIDIH